MDFGGFSCAMSYLAEIEKLADARKWQPIETAPKNTPVLIWILGEIRHAYLKSGGGWNHWLTVSGKYGMPKDYPPTHWMPLPAPPTC